ncbi:hypothetical protein FM037_22255 [Shewanella psychropiezotolerans]|uniref:Uncharacterized protein n=1 Tax=Shewanella psychropiezotolerans TaxID=2593655 RepID=A0ABX5X2B6_9GAMM|nr:hypothetical protein [Shewanella psychropiezotolerans]QDO85478.1 hypothetical protein FM037_22255 [Shewanella psychropiezotolerans]
MSNIIQLLERMGQDSELQTEQSFEQAIQESALTHELKQSLLNRDDISLKRQLDVCPDVVCAMVAHEEDDEDSTDIESSPLSIVA